jgi:hypothetical protein
MSCCGKKRALARQAAKSRKPSKPTNNSTRQPEAERDTSIRFQYTGQSKLTVVGPNTRKHYRFDGPGAVTIVDPRDRNALAAVSVLRQVSKVTNVTKGF